eukprot:14556135-Alexandrium_andersonii.AAC.1
MTPAGRAVVAAARRGAISRSPARMRPPRWPRRCAWTSPATPSSRRCRLPAARPSSRRPRMMRWTSSMPPRAQGLPYYRIV